MQAYYEIETQIPPNHLLNLQLPDSIPVGNVKITLVYEVAELLLSTRSKMVEFLAGLPELEPGQGLSIDTINAQIQQERNDWD